MIKSNKILNIISFGTLILITCLMIITTIVEKKTGSNALYTSPFMIMLWIIMSASSLIYIFKEKLYRQLITFGLHLSFIVILVGAMVTHIFGVQGSVHLTEGDGPVSSFEDIEGEIKDFPFEIELISFNLEYYAGTFSPMDYVSSVKFLEYGKELHRSKISMNNICEYKNYRFYQSGYERGGKGTILSISYDPYGITITYIGYLMLLLSMLGFFFQHRTSFRAMLKSDVLKKFSAFVLLFSLFPLSSKGVTSKVPQSPKKEVAEAFCDLYVYYNDRICPLQTLAKDFTVKVYGKSSYKGLTAEQVLTGWFFYYDDWKSERMIKIKDKKVRKLFGIQDKYAALTDYTDIHGFKLEKVLQDGSIGRGAFDANEKFNLVSMVCTGSILKIYPYKLQQDSVSVWYSFADKLPLEMDDAQWNFVRNSMSYVAETMALGDTRQTIQLLKKIKKYQEIEASDIPANIKFRAEKLYNNFNYNKIIAMICATIGILMFVLTIRKIISKKNYKVVDGVSIVFMFIVFVYITCHLSLRGYVSGHIPMSNGFETMLFMAWCTCLLTLIMRSKFVMSIPFGFLLCGMTMMVAMMGESNPKVTNLMPVLQSPLLSIHVAVIMISYSLFAFMLLNGITALILQMVNKNCKSEIEYLAGVSHIMIYPAIFLLTIGIFIGAVWANVSWGRYWGWDPKEVWALITMLIYSFGLHSRLFKWVNKPMVFHCFCILAFFAVLITYFGVNFLLGGKHSYA